jgi:hypothetical protein
MDNPIKYSEFIQPDQSVSNLIVQLEQLQTKYTELGAKIRGDADKIAKSLKNVNSATEEGREATRKSATDADKLAKANDDLKKSQSGVAKEIAVLKAKQQQQNNINKLTAKINASTEGSYNKLSAQYSLNKIKLNAMSKAQRDGSKAGKKLEKDSKALYEEMKRLQEATGKTSLNVGNYKDALAAVPGPINGVITGTKAMGKQLLVLAANPIVAIVALIAGLFILLVKAMKRSEEGQDSLNKVMVVASSIFDNVMDVLTLIGIALFDSLPKAFKMFTNNFKIFVNAFQAGILKVRIAWNEFTNDAEEADKFKKELKALQTETKNLVAEQIKLGKQIVETFSESIEKAKDLGNEIQRDIIAAKKLADAQASYNREERRVIVANAKLNKASAKARGDAEKLKLLDAEKSIETLEKSFDLDEKALANTINLAKAKASILRQTSNLAVDDIEAKKAIAEADAEVFNAETAFDNLRRQRIRRMNMLRLEAFKQQKERLKAYAALNKFEQTSAILANDAIIASDKSTYDEKNKALKANAQIAAESLKENSSITLTELNKRKELQLISDEDYALQKRVIDAKLADDILKLGTKLQKDQDKLLEAKKAAEQKAKEERFKIAEESIDQEYDLEMSRIDILKATEAEKTKLRLEAERDRIQKILDLNKKAGGDLSAVQIATMKNVIAKINQEINKAGSGGGDLYDKLGIKLNDEQKQAISDSATHALDIIQTVLDAKIEAIDAALAKQEEETSEAESKVDREIEARNNGYANNVIGAQRELELSKKKEADLLKEKNKAQKAQALIDTAMQISSLITATAELWKSNAGVPIIGAGLATAATALMWGSFAASKIKAATASKQKYGDGGMEFLQGGSHASGNDIPIGTTSSGKQRTAEGGEALAIINRKNTRKYKSALPGIIKSLNSGTFEKAYSNSFVDENNKVIFAESNSDFSKMENSLEAIRQNGEKRTYIDGEGRLVEVYKNIKRIYV